MGSKLRAKLIGHTLALVATVLLGGLLSATLVRLAPGFDADEQELDPHLSAESVQALRAARHQQRDIFHFYISYMNRAAHGDLGTSLALGQPVRTLLRDRAPLTLRLLVFGLGLGWVAALTLALTAAGLRLGGYDLLTTLVSGTFLCIPAAVLALLSVLWNVPGRWLSRSSCFRTFIAMRATCWENLIACLTLLLREQRDWEKSASFSGM